MPFGQRPTRDERKAAAAAKAAQALPASEAATRINSVAVSAAVQLETKLFKIVSMYDKADRLHTEFDTKDMDALHAWYVSARAVVSALKPTSLPNTLDG